jgi:hypothetical protein
MATLPTNINQTVNPATGKTNAQVLQESTAVAEQAAKSIGQSFSAIKQSNQTPINTTLNGARLGNVQTINVPSTLATPTTSNLALDNNSFLGQVKTDASVTPTDTSKTEAQSYLQKIMGSISGQADQEAQIAEDAGLAEKKQKAEALSTELDVMDKAYRDEVKNIKETSTGTVAGRNAEIAIATDRYENNRANLALTYKVANQDYQGAQEIVNSKVTALQNQNTQALNAYQLFADSVMNDLTESEKLQVESNLRMKENEAQAVQTAYADVLTTAVQQSAPASVLAQIDAASRAPGATPASVYASAGKYATMPTDSGADGVTGQDMMSFNEFKSQYEKELKQSIPPGTDLYNQIKTQYDQQVSNAVNVTDLTPSDQRELVQAGMTETEGTAQTYFLATPKSFRDYYKRLVSTGEIPSSGVTLDQLDQVYQIWYDSQ